MNRASAGRRSEWRRPCADWSVGERRPSALLRPDRRSLVGGSAPGRLSRSISSPAPSRHGFFDLQVYYGAINYWVARRRRRSTTTCCRCTTYGFTYPPFAALVMLPMAITPWTLAIVVSLLACAARVRAVLIYWLIDPIGPPCAAGRAGSRCRVALCFAALRAAARDVPLRPGQHVAAVPGRGGPLLLLGRGRNRWGGVGIGLATAIKLTPGHLHRLPAGHPAVAGGDRGQRDGRRRRPCSRPRSRRTPRGCSGPTRCGTPTGSASLAFISNQSLEGAVARLNQADPSTALWLAAVLVVLVIWCGALAPGGGGGGRDGRLRADRRGRLPGQPGHLGPPPGLGRAGDRAAARQRAGRSQPASSWCLR